MPRFIHIGVNSYARPVPADALAPVINEAKDWLKYAGNNWIVWTNLTPGDWYRKLKPLLHKDDSIFLAEIELSTRAGWLPESAVNWLSKDRSIDRPGI